MACEPDTRDVLIVGGGIAGLTAAAFLARSGLRVLLCEKEKKTGGLVNSFEHNGFTFDGGIRATENSGVLLPMLKQLGIEIELLANPVSIGIGKDVIEVTTKANLADYRQLLQRQFPDNEDDIAAIVDEVEKVMGFLDVLYGIDNPLFLDLKNNPKYVFKTILPWLLKYQLTVPRIAKLNAPVEEYLTKFTTNRALIDIIAQHFFRKTPAFFALSYFSIYLDYRYPKGGTGSLTRALERFVVENRGEVRKDVEITRIDPVQHRAADSAGNSYHYRKLLWAADMNTLYRVTDDTHSLTDSPALRSIQAHRQAMSGKSGGDSIFTVYLSVDKDPSWFAGISTGHFFYTPSTTGLSHAALAELTRRSPEGFTRDKAQTFDWLQRHLELNTFEISIPALRDPSMAPAGKTGLIVSLLFDYPLTRHIRAMGWYDEFRKLVSDRTIEVLDASIYPGLNTAVIDSFNSTPLTMERISGNFQGAITGWAFTNEVIPAESRMPKIARSVLTPIPDTFQAGQWTYSPSGLPVSILTGKLAADRIIKDLG